MRSKDIVKLNESLIESIERDNNAFSHSVSDSLQADIRNKLQPLQTLADLVNEGAEYDWLTDQLPKAYESIKYLSNLNSSR